MKVRLCKKCSLEVGLEIALEVEELHYLKNVLKLQTGEKVFLFNGEDGEFEGIVFFQKKECLIKLQKLIKMPELRPDFRLNLAFGLIKNNALSEVLNKCTQVGVFSFFPLITKYSTVHEFNLARGEKIIKEACEQSERIVLPALNKPQTLKDFLTKINPESPLIFCDENALPEQTFAKLPPKLAGDITLLIGPEGGFAKEEQELILSHPNAKQLSLGSFILKAEVASLCTSFLLKQLYA